MSLLLFRPSTDGAPPAPAPSVVVIGRARALLEISDTPPRDPRQWEDQTAYLREFDFSRGAPDELEQSQAGTGSIVVDNRGGRFAGIRPMRAVRLSAQSDTGTTGFTMRQSHVGGSDPLRGGVLTFPLFYGFTEGAPQSWPERSDTVAWVTLRVSDAFAAVFTPPEFAWGHRYQTLDPGPDDWPCGFPTGNLTPDNGPPFIPDELTGARINRVLDCLEWPEADRLIDPGIVTILGSNQSQGGTANFRVQENALSHLQAVAMTEGGRIFIDAAGRVRFIDAAHLPELDSGEVYGDIPGEIRYRDIQTDSGIGRVWNQITVNSTEPSQLGSASAEDAASIEEFYVPRPKSFTVLPVVAAVMQDRATELLARYKDPITRITSMSLKPVAASTLRRVISRELADQPVIRRRPQDAPAIEQNSRIENFAISAAYDDPYWVITLQLSAA
jgi:hypothetical protein